MANSNYIQKIALAIAFIEDNLDKSIGLDDIASHCHFSAYHFHRIFSGVMRETLNQYVARRRLERAVNLLLFQRALSITDIALGCGYSSSANFAKAVKKHFGYAPSAIRKPMFAQEPAFNELQRRYGKTFNLEALYPANNKTHGVALEDLNLNIVDAQSLRLCTLASNNGYDPESLFETWDALAQWGELHGIPVADQFRVAWCYDNPAITPIKKCRYEASIAISNDVIIEAPFSISEFPQGKYAALRVKGTPEDVQQAKLRLFSDWLPSSSYEPDNLPLLERYCNDVRIDGFVDIEILLKIKALA